MKYEINDPQNTVIIEKASNEGDAGFVLSKFEEYFDGDGFHIRKQPIEYSEFYNDNEDWDAVIRMLWSLLYMLEVRNNKHSNKELIIEVKEYPKDEF